MEKNIYVSYSECMVVVILNKGWVGWLGWVGLGWVAGWLVGWVGFGWVGLGSVGWLGSVIRQWGDVHDILLSICWSINILSRSSVRFLELF